VQKVGHYQIVSELHSQSSTFYYRAQSDKHLGREFLLTVHETADHSTQKLEEFVRIARERKFLTDKIGGLVDVADIGREESLAYYATEYYPDDIESLLTRGFKFDSERLKTLMVSVVRILQDIFSTAHRYHGNLSANTIVLTGTGAFAKRTVKLRDPTPDAYLDVKDSSRGLSRDLKAMGDVIDMVCNRFDLGNKAKDWKKIAESLKSETGSYSGGQLDLLERDIQAIGSLKAPIIAVASLLLLIGGGVGAYFILGFGSSVEQVPIEKQYVDYRVGFENWLSSFGRTCIRRQVGQPADHFSRTLFPLSVEEAQALDPESAFQYDGTLPMDPRIVPPELLENKTFQEGVEGAYSKMLEIQKQIEEWPVRQQLRGHIQQLERLGASSIANDLKPLTGDIVYNQDLYEQLDTINQANDAWNSILKQWRQSLNRAEKLTKPLGHYGANFASGYQRDLRQARSAEDFREVMASFNEEMDDMQSVLGEIDLERHRYDIYLVDLKASGRSLSNVQDLKDWAVELEQYRKVPHPKRASSTEEEALWHDVDRILADLKTMAEASDYADLKRRMDDLKRRGRALDETPAIKRDEQSLARQSDQFLTDLRQYRQSLAEHLSPDARFVLPTSITQSSLDIDRAFTRSLESIREEKVASIPSGARMSDPATRRKIDQLLEEFNAEVNTIESYRKDSSEAIQMLSEGKPFNTTLELFYNTRLNRSPLRDILEESTEGRQFLAKMDKLAALAGEGRAQPLVEAIESGDGRSIQVTAWNRIQKLPAASTASLSQALSAADRAGLDTSALPDEVRMEIMLHDHISSSEVEGLKGQQGQVVADQVTRLKSQLDQLNGAPEARAFLERMERDINPFEEVAFVDFSQVGPGILPGWRYSGSTDGSSVTYSWSGYEQTFHEVRSDSGQRYFIAETELPVGLVIEWLGSADRWDNFWAAGADYGDGSVRGGPVTWEIAGDGGERQGSLAIDWLPNLFPTWMGQEYAPSVDAGLPAAEHPIQYITPGMAEVIAQAFNCNLPTAEAFNELISQSSGQQNLRDQAWQRQQSHVAEMARQLNAFDSPWPDNGVFIPEGVNVRLAEDAAAAVSTNDGAVWFEEVSSGSGQFKQVIGNVAEYVRLGGGGIGVMGGSALSPSEVSPRQYYAVSDSPVGYSDVGMRLAFNLPDQTPGTAFVRILEEERKLLFTNRTGSG